MSYEPTKQEIKEACAAIRDGWSERERKKRLAASMQSVPFTIPEVVDPELQRRQYRGDDQS